jgi:hypothetical protein
MAQSRNVDTKSLDNKGKLSLTISEQNIAIRDRLVISSAVSAVTDKD